MKLPALAAPVLVGREHEVAKLEAFLCSASEGKGKTVLISGEAGSGKTRLTNEFLKKAKDRGVSTLTGWCLSNAAVPYFPFFEAFNAFFTAESDEGTENNTSVTNLLKGPTLTNAPEKKQIFSPQVWKDQTFAAVAKTLISLALKKTVILFLDDIHWADSASLSLIHYLARVISSERVLLLATFRSEQLTCDADGKTSALAETIRLMRREELFEEVKLANLSEASVNTLAKSMLGGNMQDNFSKKLSEESQGNALFVVESIRMLSERNGLVQERGEWRVSSEEIGIPDKIKDIISQRLGVLHRDQRRVLNVASVIGEKFNAELVAAVLSQDYLKVADDLEVIAQSTSLVWSEGNTFRFDHARSRDAVYDGLSPTLKKGYHARIAEKLENSSKDFGKLPFSELVYHEIKAENAQKAVKYALAAGEDELAKWSNVQAIKHFSYVLENVEAQTEEKRKAQEGLGDAYFANSMYAEALKTFDELAASETGTTRLRAIRKATDAAFRKGDEPDILFDYAKKAEELAHYDRLEMARILDNRGRAFFWARRGSIEMEVADYDAALQVFEEENSIADAAVALTRSGCVSTLINDRRERSLGELARAITIFKELNDVRNEVWAILNFGLGLRICGLHPEAKREFARVLTTGEKMDVFDEMAQASIWFAELIEKENYEDAVRRTLKALEYSTKTDASWIQNFAHARLCLLYSKHGDVNHAEEYYEKIAKLPPEVLKNALIGLSVARAKKAYLSVKTSRWKELLDLHEDSSGSLRNIAGGARIFLREEYAWALEKDGRFEEAKIQRGKNEELLRQVEARFGQANFRLGIMVPRKVCVGEESEMRLDIVNVGRRPGKLVRIVGATPPEFRAVLPLFCSRQDDGSFEIREKTIDGFQTETIKLKFVTPTKGTYCLNPEVLYQDDSGQAKTFSLQPITITVQPAKPKYETLPGRVPTGYDDLDALLFGGIPERQAVILSSASTSERELITREFVTTGLAAGELVFYITTDTLGFNSLAETHPTNFNLFICNSQAGSTAQERPNIYWLKGVENLTDIDIAITKAFRNIDTSIPAARRICIEIIPDALLQHHAINTRRWLNALLPTLKTKGFTILATINPKMHLQEEVEAILGIFEGEIRVTEKETAQGTEQTLRIRKLLHQKYVEKEIVLTKEALKI